MRVLILICTLFVIIVSITLYNIFARYDVDEMYMIQRIKNNLSYMNPNISNIPIYPSSSSYIQNKSTIYLCMKDPYSRRMYDINTLMYVVLHEIAHFVSNSYSTSTHNTEFYSNFDKLLQKAITIGIYDNSKPIPIAYCGLK